MTTSQVENHANMGGLATPDFPLKATLRYKVIPQFLIDVGSPKWTKNTGSITTVAGSRDYQMPDDFQRMRLILAPSGYKQKELNYCGENDELVLQLDNESEPGKPTHYNVVRTADGYFRAVRLYPTPDAAYVFPYLYTRYVPFRNESEEKDLSAYIPEALHWGLVEGLRKEIYRDRFGEGDQRYVSSDYEYQSWVNRANRMDMREPGPRGNRRVYAR